MAGDTVLRFFRYAIVSESMERSDQSRTKYHRQFQRMDRDVMRTRKLPARFPLQLATTARFPTSNERGFLGRWSVLTCLLLALQPLNSEAASTSSALERQVKECESIAEPEKQAQCLKDAIELLSAIKDPDSLKSWKTMRKTDPMTDRQNVIVTKAATEGISDNGAPYMLSIRCENKKTKMAFHWNTYIGLDSAPLKLRVDKKRPNTTTWKVTEGGHTLFWPKHRHIPGMVKRWFDAEQIVVQTNAYGQGTLTAIFDISDLEDGVKPVRETCGW